MNTTTTLDPQSDPALDSLIAELVAIARPHLKFLEEGAEFGPDDQLGDAGLDSMASINLLLDIEDELGVTIPDELIEENSFETIRRVAELVQKARQSA